MNFLIGSSVLALTLFTVSGFLEQSSDLQRVIPVADGVSGETGSILDVVPSCWEDVVYGYGQSVVGQGSGPTTNGSGICFGTEGSLGVISFGGDEILESGGKYKLLLSKTEFTTELSAEGWNSVFSADKVICDVQLFSHSLFELQQCSDGRTNRRFYRMGKEDERYFLDH